MSTAQGPTDYEPGQTAACAKCGLARKEHAYSGAGYGKCADFISSADVALVVGLIGNAIENGYDVLSLSDEDLAQDLNRYAEDVESWRDDYLTEVVKVARKRRAG